MKTSIILKLFITCSFLVIPVTVLAQFSRENIVKEQPVQVDVQFSSYTEKEFMPQIDQEIYTWSESSWLIRSQFNWRESYFSIAWKETAIEQQNELFNDLDFAIKSRGPVFGVIFPVGSNISCNAEIDIAQYDDTSTNAFYTLTNSNGSASELFYSGFFQTTYSGRDSWTTLSYNRFRDTEPLYDPSNNRAELNIRARELIGISTGWRFIPEWELAGSVFFEEYDTGTPDQFNINSDITYRPQKIKQLNLSLGGGYYTEEEEIIVNFAANYGLKWSLFDLSLSYQLEYSDNERSLLHEATASLKYYLNKKVSFLLRGNYGQETGDDRDSVSSVTTRLNLLF